MTPTTLLTRPAAGLAQPQLPARSAAQLTAAATPAHAKAHLPATEPVRQLGVLNGLFMDGLVRGLTLSDVLPGAALQEFARDFRAEAAATGDPLEALLLGQAALANFAAGALLIRAAMDPVAGNACDYAAAATKLMAECRRTSEAATDVRRGGKPPAKVEVEQFNLATAGGSQQIGQVRPRKKKS